MKRKGTLISLFAVALLGTLGYLWLAPAGLLVIGFIALARIVRRRSQLPIDQDAT